MKKDENEGSVIEENNDKLKNDVTKKLYFKKKPSNFRQILI